MPEYRDLIQEEKQQALRNFNENAFRLGLNRKIKDKVKSRPYYLQWFRTPAVAGSTVLLVFLFVWLSTKIFLPITQESDEILLKNTFVQLFTQHGTLFDQRQQLFEQAPGESAAVEFQWTIKRVLLAIQREKAQGVDISESLRRVLQNAALLIKEEKSINGGRNI
jgi:hypothetical protein